MKDFWLRMKAFFCNHWRDVVIVILLVAFLASCQGLVNVNGSENSLAIVDSVKL